MSDIESGDVENHIFPSEELILQQSQSQEEEFSIVDLAGTHHYQARVSGMGPISIENEIDNVKSDISSTKADVDGLTENVEMLTEEIEQLSEQVEKVSEQIDTEVGNQPDRSDVEDILLSVLNNQKKLQTDTQIGTVVEQHHSDLMSDPKSDEKQLMSRQSLDSHLEDEYNLQRNTVDNLKDSISEMVSLININAKYDKKSLLTEATSNVLLGFTLCVSAITVWQVASPLLVPSAILLVLFVIGLLIGVSGSLTLSNRA